LSSGWQRTPGRQWNFVPTADVSAVRLLDPSIDADKISAKIDQGLVKLILPKAEHVKPRKIAVS
jgi:HSP20 family molecular chaperone IbpA